MDEWWKGNPPARKVPLVVTRPGGTLTLDEGRLTYTVREFPALEEGRTYLHFLKAVPKNGAYFPIDALSTLMLTEGGQWTNLKPLFSRRASAAGWSSAGSCQSPCFNSDTSILGARPSPSSTN